jgi:DNA-directed RNA polymerase specialized sigma24 family protein
VRKFKVPEQDAEILVQEILTACILSPPALRDSRAWVIGATCNASRGYWRRAGKREPLDPADHEVADERYSVESIDARIAAGQCLSRVDGKFREALLMRYVDGCSLEEIARNLETTTEYARKLIRVGIRRVQEQ